MLIYLFSEKYLLYTFEYIIDISNHRLCLRDSCNYYYASSLFSIDIRIIYDDISIYIYKNNEKYIKPFVVDYPEDTFKHVIDYITSKLVEEL